MPITPRSWSPRAVRRPRTHDHDRSAHYSRSAYRDLRLLLTLDAFTKTTIYNPAGHASVIEDDTTNNVVAGDFYLQTVPPSVISVKGTWVFGLAGRRYDYLTGTYTLPTPSTGTLTGRGTLSVAGANGKYTNFVFYPSGVGRFDLMVSDAIGDTYVEGE
jgi:hypothetical protein